MAKLPTNLLQFVLRMEYTCFKTVEHNNKKRAERTPYGIPISVQFYPVEENN
jgi:hypothetical protein